MGKAEPESHGLKDSWGSVCVCPREATGLRNELPGWLGQKDPPLLLPDGLGLGQSQRRVSVRATGNPGSFPGERSFELEPERWMGFSKT